MQRPIAFVTGASGDIGWAISEKLASLGYSLILHFNKNKEQVENLKDKLEKEYDIECRLVQADFSNPTATLEVVKKDVLPLEPDLLIHNSGSSYVGLFTQMSDEQVANELTIGLTTPLLVTKLLTPSMIRKREGKIVVISSVWGLVGASCEVVYSTVKGGLNTFVKSLSKELAPSQIQVNGVAPGAIQTKMLNHLESEDISLLEEDIPAGYLGKPEDVASTVGFLVSKDSHYINGQIISVNGAWFC